MVKYLIAGVACIGAGVLSFLLWNASRIPNFDDAAVAAALGQSVSKAYGHFVPRVQADRTGQGPALYEHPGAHARPTLVIYGVDDAAQRALIVSDARASLDKVQAHGATLKFYDHQNVKHYPGGGIRRGPETLIATVQVTTGG
jgi:hypothetical protein